MWLLAPALFGFIVPNGLFLYWLLFEFHGLAPIIQDKLALGFILDAFLVLVLLGVYFTRRPIGPVRWPWFVLLSLLGDSNSGCPSCTGSTGGPPVLSPDQFTGYRRGRVDSGARRYPRLSFTPARSGTRGGPRACNKVGPMARSSDSADSARSKRPAGSIADRVRLRVDAAGAAFDRRNSASRPKRRRPGAVVPLVPLTDSDAEVLHRRERACLRTVFLELGEAHRRYRARTGEVGTPALRAAANAFKSDPSVGLLIPVATFLDDLGILTW